MGIKVRYLPPKPLQPSNIDRPGIPQPRYVTFSTLPVAKTIESPCGTVMIDLAADGSVVGVEIL